MTFIIHITVLHQIEINLLGFRCRDTMLAAILNREGLSMEVIEIDKLRTVVEIFRNILLQVVYEISITFRGNHAKAVNLLHLSLQGIGILTHSLVVNAESQTSSHVRTLLRDAVRLSERTDLEDVRVIPNFSQGRVGEDEANR